jgi:hypothetical protein
MKALIQQERFSRIKTPVHKFKAKTPVELFQYIPNLRRYFQNLSNTAAQLEVEVPVERLKEDDDQIGGYDVKKMKVDGYEAVPIDIVRIITYIVLVYDPDTDLIHEFPNEIRAMKDEGATVAGFERLENGDWPPYVERIITFQDKHVVRWIIDYLKVKKNTIWTEIKFIEEELETLYRQRTNALLTGSVNSALMDTISVRLEKRDALYKRFYAEHVDLKNETQDELYPVTPENVFKELKIPPEVWRVKQVKDVPKDTGVN